jgi:signal transduction histidine kinase
VAAPRILATPARWLRHPRTTVRGRLTLLYGGMFLACGVVLLAITYLLVEHTFPVVHQTTGLGADRLAGTLPSTKPPARTSPSAMAALINHYRSADLHQLLIESGVALAIMVIAALALGWVVAGRVLRPLRTITSATQQISEQNLHQRLALEGPNDELKHLGDTIDALLARLDRAFDAQRRFVANASHELRTPVTVGCTLLEMILGDPHPTIESFRATCIDVLESEQQQAQRIEALLTLAQGQAGLDQPELLDLADITDQVLLTRRAEAHQRGLDLRATLSPAVTTGAPELVARLVANLVDNALHYNTPHGEVEIATAASTNHAILTITNTGPIVPTNAVAQLFQPFHRLTADRTTHGQGIGLGLSIVQAIADAHHATINAQPQPTGGLKITVSFPNPITRPTIARDQRPPTDQAPRPLHERGTTRAPISLPRPRAAAAAVPGSSRHLREHERRSCHVDAAYPAFRQQQSRSSAASTRPHRTRRERLGSLSLLTPALVD